MDGSDETRWIRRHAMFVPFGVFAVTALLTYWSEQGVWQTQASLRTAATLVDLGVALYGMIAVLTEGGVRLMFWALDQRRKWRRKLWLEAREEGIEEGIERGIEKGIEAGVKQGYAQAYQEIAEREERLERRAREMGISLAEPQRKREE